MRRNAHGQDAVEPLGTECASTVHHGVVECTLCAEQIDGVERVAAFPVKYHGSGIAVGLSEPLDTVTNKDRLALVTVVIKGTPYVIVDIGLRMLKPHELYRAQGFPCELHNRPNRGRHAAQHQCRGAHGRQQRQPAAAARTRRSQPGPGRSRTEDRRMNQQNTMAATAAAKLVQQIATSLYGQAGTGITDLTALSNLVAAFPLRHASEAVTLRQRLPCSTCGKTIQS